jgi:phage protein D
MSTDDVFGFAMSVAGAELPTLKHDQVAEITVDARIDQLARATVVVNILDRKTMELDRALIDTFAVGASITIALGHDAPYSEVFSGEITGVELRLAANSQLVAHCRCPAVALLRAQAGSVLVAEANTAAAVTATAAVQSLVSAAGLTPDISGLEGGLPHAVQWWGDGWRAVRHLARRAGCVTYSSKGKLHVGKPAFSGAALATLTWGRDPIRLDFGLDARHLPTTVVARGLDAKHAAAASGQAPLAGCGHPQASALNSALGKVPSAGPRTLPDAGGVSDPDTLTRVAGAAMTHAALRALSGRGVCAGNPDLHIDGLIQLDAVGPYSGLHYLSRVEHHMTAERFDTSFEIGLPDDEASGGRDEDAGIAQPAPRGLVRGVVDSFKDPAKLGCVRVSFPWLGDQLSPIWAPVAAMGAGKGRGLVIMPEPGDEVLVGFVDGDLGSPVVVGSLWNTGQTIPAAAYDTDTNNLRSWTSRSGHCIELDDKDGSERIRVVSKAGQSLVIDDAGGKESITLSDKTGNVIKASADGIALTAASGKDITLAASGGKIALSANEITCEGQSSVALKGAQCAVEGSAKLDLKGAQVAVAGTAQVKVNAAMIMLN